ncbi:hypothetical protein F5Y05DRAFT_407084 [Hypoxylon sp. FL0543]|nr:hypothetical protein F5Y05DRAFT_407084 [Hypoxylon sp. FL0543]
MHSHLNHLTSPMPGAPEFIGIGDLQAESVQRGPDERCKYCHQLFWRCWCNVPGGSGSGGSGSGGSGSGGNGSGGKGSGKGGNNGGGGGSKSHEDDSSDDDDYDYLY